MWFHVLTARVDINKTYYVYPPPTFQINNQLPDKWSELTLKRNFLPKSPNGRKAILQG